MDVYELNKALENAKAELEPCPLCGCKFPNIGCTIFFDEGANLVCEGVRVKCPVCNCTVSDIPQEGESLFFSALSDCLEIVTRNWNKRETRESTVSNPNELPF